MPNYWSGKRVTVTGAHGFVGKHLVRALTEQGAAVYLVSRQQYDLRHEADVSDLFKTIGKCDVFFHLAAHVGGIGANQKAPAQMYSDNVLMDTNVISYAAHYNVGCFVGMGSVCAYPKFTPVPFKESDLWNGYPEETNAAYGMAKRGMLACLMAHGQEYGLNWRYALSTNLYGPGDNYGEGGHVIAHLIKKFMDSKINGGDHITMWGNGDVTRDFLYVSDVVNGLMTLAEKGNCEPINLASGKEISIRNLAFEVECAVFGRGDIHFYHFDESKPSGQPWRVLNISKARGIGWSPKVSLKEGLLETVNAYRESVYA